MSLKQRNLKQRDQFNFYKSFDDICLRLDDKKFAIFLRTILDVQFLRIKYSDVKFEDEILDLLWQSCKFNIEAQIDGYLANKNKNKDQFIGVYQNENGGSDGGSDSPCDEEQEQEEEQEKEECTASIENEFQSLWKGYTLTFLKKQGRKGGLKAKAKTNFIKLRKKYDNETILKMVRSHASQKIGHKDLERLLLEDYMEQYLEDNSSQEQQTKPKELKVIGE